MHLYLLVFAPPLAHQCLLITAALRYRVSQRNLKRQTISPVPVSVLKPVRGLDPNTHAAFVSQVQQNFPRFEILFGVRDRNDPVVAEVQRLQAQFPATDIRLIFTEATALNAKVASLVDLGKQAQYPVWVVNDGDIKVGPDYLAAVTAPLQNPSVGLVTCLYRAWAHSKPTAWEALGITADFMLGVLAADLLGIRDYGLGATLCFRREDLQAVGGFEGIADFIADDYQIGHRIAKMGKPTFLSPYTVETALAEDTWLGVWLHQLRWARTIRASKPGSYAGVPIGHAGIWIAIALLCHAWHIALVLLVLRLCSALASTIVMHNRPARRFFWLAPVWDLFGFAVWVTCYAGNEVRWRDHVLQIDRDGRILR